MFSFSIVDTLIKDKLRVTYDPLAKKSSCTLNVGKGGGPFYYNEYYNKYYNKFAYQIKVETDIFIFAVCYWQ